MSGRIKDAEILFDRVIKMLPKGVPTDAIKEVEWDPYDGEDGGPSYWVYLASGWICPEMECHTIHEDTLAKLKPLVKSIEPWPDDPDLKH